MRRVRFQKKRLKNKQKTFKNEELLNTLESFDSAISENIERNIEVLKSIYKDCFGIVFREFLIGGNVKACLIYFDGLSDTDECNENVLYPLMNQKMEVSNLEETVSQTLSVSETIKIQTYQDVIDSIPVGKPVLLCDQFNYGFSLGLQQWEQRAVAEPQSETLIRGPREGFTETFQVNAALLRRKLPTPYFKIKTKNIGRITKTLVGICYIEEIADETLITEVENRLNRIDIDAILESGYIEELIEDDPSSPFPQMMNTERPDKAIGNLLEGRVVLLIDGTPFVLVMPVSIYSLFQTTEDYYQRFYIGTAIRLLRHLFIVIALLLPSLYVAILSYHQEMIPTTLLISIAASREIVPFPVIVEALFMETIFELLREAGLRLPQQVGSTVSIVGGLIIGEAAIQAGIVSAPMVIAVATTGIASFAIPHYNVAIAIRIIRFPLIILAGALGLLGVILGIIMVVLHLCTLRSFGLPYLSPLAPIEAAGIKDVLYRVPMWKLNSRPRLTGKQNKYRQAPNQKPGPLR